jgi:hypothetical protein
MGAEFSAGGLLIRVGTGESPGLARKQGHGGFCCMRLVCGPRGVGAPGFLPWQGNDVLFIIPSSWLVEITGYSRPPKAQMQNGSRPMVAE